MSVPRSLAFDPRSVPVQGVDAHLPAVDPESLQAHALRQRFAVPPVWSPELRAEPLFTNAPARPAAVLVPLVERAEGLTVLLTQRTADLPTHAGQVAFPGGKIDDHDADAICAALREAHEEVGLEPALVSVLGSLPVYTTGSAFHVTPVVALVHTSMQLRLNAREVADAFEVPLAFLMNPAHHRRHALQWAGLHRAWFSMPYQDGASERFIWGATAGILRNFYRFLAA